MQSNETEHVQRVILSAAMGTLRIDMHRYCPVYQAAVISSNGEHTLTEMADSAALLSRLAFVVSGFHPEC
jgi:hypothetical protein